MKQTKCIPVAIILVIAAAAGAVYLSGSLEPWGICRPGETFTGGLIPSCGILSPFEGRLCDTQADCGGSAGCALVDKERPAGKGVCRTLPFGCNTWIDENGTFNESDVLCVD